MKHWLLPWMSRNILIMLTTVSFCIHNSRGVKNVPKWGLLWSQCSWSVPWFKTLHWRLPFPALQARTIAILILVFHNGSGVKGVPNIWTVLVMLGLFNNAFSTPYAQKVSQSVILLTCVWEMAASNFSREARPYWPRFLVVFLSSSREMRGIILQIRPRLPSSTVCPVHYSVSLVHSVLCSPSYRHSR